ncbi:MAG: hypothetical protein ABJN57_06405 [Hyphomicrobiales bacterium]
MSDNDSDDNNSVNQNVGVNTTPGFGHNGGPNLNDDDGDDDDNFDWAPNKNQNQLWSKGKEKIHYRNHGQEVGANSQKEYTTKALEFGTKPPKGSIKLKTSQGQYIYDPSSKRIFVGSPKSGKIKTFYRWDGRANDAVINALKDKGLF